MHTMRLAYYLGSPCAMVLRQLCAKANFGLCSRFYSFAEAFGVHPRPHSHAIQRDILHWSLHWHDLKSGHKLAKINGFLMIYLYEIHGACISEIFQIQNKSNVYRWRFKNSLYTNMGSYEPGELVFSSEPFCHIVKSNVKSGVCDYCLYVQSDENQCSMKQCSGCKLVYYCGPPKNCQNNAQYHLKECKYHYVTYLQRIGSVILIWKWLEITDNLFLAK